MKKSIILKRRLAKCLRSIVSWLESQVNVTDNKSKFVDLAPTDEADKDGVYSEALLYATNNPRVYNIALTGPYGSGKSSIIQSFLKTYRSSSLHISLASFIPEVKLKAKDTSNQSEGAPNHSDVTRQEIERSILQQMLYGADANKLPLSRFKRIQSPRFWSSFKTLYITIGILALWYMFSQQNEIFNGSFPLPFSLESWQNQGSFLLPLLNRSWFNLGITLIAGSFLWTTIHYLYVASFGLSLKSISLKDVEIKSANDDQASILNRHLDEIIYFFQSTKYELVIIEDLDRFEEPEIFVTLREINRLVNENAGINRKIRFLYALRDDIFANTERTKFFEFIVPVIPIINTSNSIDMVLEQGVRLELDERLDRQFLREVSRYLNDLRLIQNIFNEYAIYVDNLGENLLDANKLLAILIYKNVYPRDFEQLHRGAGVIFKILNIKDELIAPSEFAYREKIEELEKQLEVAEQQVPSNLIELKKIYAINLIEKLNPDTLYVRYQQGNWVPLKELHNHDAFEELIEAPSLVQRNTYNHQNNINLSHLKSETEPQKTYKQRKAEVESKSEDNKSKILRHIRDLRSKIEVLRMKKLNEILRLNIDRMADVFKTLGENGELARFLVLEGHLDDTYYQYTSLFHSGRLSPNDNKFLIQIRAFVTPEPDFPIDNPKEVIAAMRDEDFRQSYVLNVKLVDCLINERSHYISQTQKLFEFLSSGFENSEGFLEAYYSSGCNVVGLFSGLSNYWSGLVPAMIASHNNISHISRLIASLPEAPLKNLGRDFNALPEFVSENLSEILVSSPELEPRRLACLEFEVKDLASIKEHSEIVRFMFGEGLFEITIPNLEFAYQVILGEKDLDPLHKKNYTTLRAMKNTVLIKRVECEFQYYLGEILLALKENSEEDASAITAILCHDKLEEGDLQLFLQRQVTRLPTLEDIPDKFHTMLFNLTMIEPTWFNCLNFIEGEVFEADRLIEYLEQDIVREIILKQPIPSDSSSFKLRQFIINAGSISDDVYREYIHALPNPFKGFPVELETAKLQVLIDERKVTFSQESLDELESDYELQIMFAANNIVTYLTEPESYNRDDHFLESLLRVVVDDEYELEIVKLMDLELLVNNPDRASLIAPIIHSADEKAFDLDADIVRALIEYSEIVEIKVSFLNKYQGLFNSTEVREILADMPRPYCDIKTGYNTPTLENTPENKELVSWLEVRKIISSWKEGGLYNDKIRVNLFRR